MYGAVFTILVQCLIMIIWLGLFVFVECRGTRYVRQVLPDASGLEGGTRITVYGAGEKISFW
jgi:hypothetical protein